MKLILEEISTTSTANLKNLAHNLKFYKINANCPGKDVALVTRIFRHIFNIINALREEGLLDEVSKAYSRYFKLQAPNHSMECSRTLRNKSSIQKFRCQ